MVILELLVSFSQTIIKIFKYPFAMLFILALFEFGNNMHKVL